MSRFFRSPTDLAGWVRNQGSAEKAARILVNLPKVGEEHVADVVETTRRIVQAKDANAAGVLWDILRTAGIVEDDVKKAEDGVDKVEAADEMLRRKLVTAEQHQGIVKEAQIMRQPGQYDMPLRLCPKLPWSVGKKLISTYNCRHYCLDGIVLDDDPMRVYCGELLWRRHIADKFSSDQQDRKTGELVGGYINERFFKFPDAGTPANPDVPRDGGNPMMLKPGERSRQPRPHQWSTERRMQEAREKNSTKGITLGKKASGWLGRMVEAQVPDGSVLDLGYTPNEQRTGAVGERGLCPVCGTECEIVGKTQDGRLVGLCDSGRVKEAFTLAQWQAPDDGSDLNDSDPVKTAQVSVGDMSEATTARGTIVKSIKGVEFELEWTYSEPDEIGEVEFEWPEAAMFGATPGEWGGDVANPATGEKLIDGAEREAIEQQWAEEVMDAIFSGDADVTASSVVRIVEAKKKGKGKKKGKPVNPWAVCHTTVDKKADPDKYERCVLKVKKEHPVKSSEEVARQVFAAAAGSIVTLSSAVVKATDGDGDVVTAFEMAIDLRNEGIDDKDSVLRIAESTGMTIEAASRIQHAALKKLAAHVSDVYKAPMVDEAPAEGEEAKPAAKKVVTPEVQQDAVDVGLVE